MDQDTTMMANGSTGSSCPRSLDQFNTTGDFMQLLAPPTGDRESEYWSDKTPAWTAFFYIMLIIFALLFLALAVVCLLMLAKRHLAQRFKVRTFIAIDVALTILGLSRVFFIILDPWGQSGFCTHVACVVFSRLSGALAFPSLTASYTLVFITLWTSAKIQLGRSSYQNYKILIPLCFIHYAVAIVFEIIGLIPWPSRPDIIMYLLIACEAIFSIWGFLVCFGYLFAGYRLLHNIEKSARNSSRICIDSPNLTRQQLVEKSKFQNRQKKARTLSNLKLKDMVREHHRRAIRKVSIIMYLSVILGMLYSILSLVQLILIVLTMFIGCPGFINALTKQEPGIWLFIRYLFFIIELLLAVLLTYSICDYRPVLIALRGALKTCCRVDIEASPRKASPEIGLNSSSINTFDVPSSPCSKYSASPKGHHVKFTFEETKPELEKSVKDNHENSVKDNHVKFAFEKTRLESEKTESDREDFPPSDTSEPNITASLSSVMKESREYLPHTPSPLTTSSATHSNSVS